jgi:uncharacterized membrane protein
MEPGVALIILLALLLLIVVPILAISAFVRVQKLEKTSANIPQLLGRVYVLEQKLAHIDETLTKLLLSSVRPKEAPAASIPAPPARVTPAAAPPEPHAPLVVSAATRPGAPPPTSRQPAATLSAPFSTANATPSAHGEGENFETLIAGRWLNYVGILALLFAVAFFLKYAFDNNWVGPRGRVGLGLLMGSSLFPFSHKLLDRGYEFFSEGIAGLGAAVLYLSLWAGWHYYHIFPQSAAFALMIVVTVATAIVAVGRNSERIAVLALLGGVVTPEIVSTGRNQEVVLFTYLAVLGAGLLVLARMRDWKTLPPIQFLATLVYFWGWYADFYNSAALGRTILFATVFFLLFAALPMARGRREGELSMLEGGIVLVNALAYLVTLRVLLWPQHRWILTLAVIALAALHLVSERALPEKPGAKPSLAQVLFAGLALLFVTLVIPIRLDGRWITMTWAIEGAILIWSGLRIRIGAVRGAGYLLFLVVMGRVAFISIPATRFLLNARFAVFVVSVACFLLAWHFGRTSGIKFRDDEEALLGCIAVTANIGALVALSLEIWGAFGRMQSLEIDRGLAQQLALSSLWLLYALGLIAAGVAKKSAALRWQALALLGIVIGKVFFLDLSFLDRFYRIVSFLLLGLVLMMISFYYQRRLLARGNEKKSP